jgi:hypothetical protein
LPGRALPGFEVQADRLYIDGIGCDPGYVRSVGWEVKFGARMLCAHAKRSDRSVIAYRMPDIRIRLAQILLSGREAMR